MFKKILIRFLLFIFIAGYFAACDKTIELNEPFVELINPAENSQVEVPDTLKILFRIESDRPVASVAVSIVNKNYTSISGINTIVEPELEKELQITKLVRDQQKLDEAPYYIKIAVNDGIEIWNSYFKIQMTKKPKVYKGFYLFSRPGIHHTDIDFYDRNLNETAFIQSSGEYVGSDISWFFNRIYILTSLPHKLHAYAINEALSVWDADPQFPNPGFTDIQLDEENIYAAMQNGQVTGYSQLSGQQKVITELPTDTFPERICVLKDYIVGDFLARIGGNKMLMTFFKKTGVRKQRYPLDFEPVSMLGVPEPNAILLVGNTNDKGKVAWYNATLNIFEFSQQFNEGQIHAVCETTAENILLAIGNSLYLYNYKFKILSFISTLEEKPGQIYYEKQTKQLVLMFDKSLVFLSYPGLSELARLEHEQTLKGLKFYYQYD